jgi:hypothetical protein
MKKIVGFLAFAVLLGASSAAFAEVTFANLSFAEALKQAKKENKLVMVDYYTTGAVGVKYSIRRRTPTRQLANMPMRI